MHFALKLTARWVTVFGVVGYEPCDVPSRYGVQARNTKPDDNQEYRAFGGQSLLTLHVKITLPDGARACFISDFIANTLFTIKL